MRTRLTRHQLARSSASTWRSIVSIDDLQKKIANAVARSGYPLEQRVGHLLELKGWHSFYSVNYTDPSSGCERELDVLAYKIIQERRIELRISCKRSLSKPWILFTQDAQRYVKNASVMKVSPVCSDINRYRQRLTVLKDLKFFSHSRRAINFTVFSGKELSNKARALMKDGLYSSLLSVYHRLFPWDLLSDQRGTIYFFVTVFDGLLFESYYDVSCDADKVTQIDYGQWEKRFQLHRVTDEISDANGRKVPLSSVLYYFSDWFRVEIVTWNYFSEYVEHIEKTFECVTESHLELFGLPWRSENFPPGVGPMPNF